METFHAQGFGYGEISKAYALAQASGLTVDELLARHRAGEGWGQIARDLGFKLHGGVPNSRVMPLSGPSLTIKSSSHNIHSGQNLKQNGPGQGSGNNSGGQSNGNGNGNGNQGGNGNGNGHGHGHKP